LLILAIINIGIIIAKRSAGLTRECVAFGGLLESAFHAEKADVEWMIVHHN